MNSQQVTKWTLESINLEELKNRLEYAFENVVEYMPYLVPVFGGEVPNEEGVSEQYKLTDQGLKFQGNNYIFGYTGNDQFGVMSWDEDRLLVFDEHEQNLHIVSRSDFDWWWFDKYTESEARK